LSPSCWQIFPVLYCASCCLIKTAGFTAIVLMTVTGLDQGGSTMKKTLTSVGMLLFISVVGVGMFVASHRMMNADQFNAHMATCPYCAVSYWAQK